MTRQFFIYKSRMPLNFQPSAHLKMRRRVCFQFVNSDVKFVVGGEEDLAYNSCLSS